MKFFLLLSILLASTAANATPRFCVGNFSNQKINWQLSDSDGNGVALETAHAPGENNSGFLCAENLDLRMNYSLSIKGTSNTCLFHDVRADDWVKVGVDRGHLNCEYNSDTLHAASSAPLAKTQSAAVNKCTSIIYASFLQDRTVRFEPLVSSFLQAFRVILKPMKNSTEDLCLVIPATGTAGRKPHIVFEAVIDYERIGMLTIELDEKNALSCKVSEAKGPVTILPQTCKGTFGDGVLRIFFGVAKK